MKACVRVATRKELPGFIRPLVCVWDERVIYRYDSWSGTVSDHTGQVLTRRSGSYNDHSYQLPDGTTLRIALKNESLYFDGHRVEERWPSPHQRILVTGKRVFSVKPEDDTIWFDVAEEVPRLDLAIVGFLLVLEGPR